MEPAQIVPLVCMAREICFRTFFTRRTDCRQLAAVCFAVCRELRIFPLGNGEQSIDRCRHGSGVLASCQRMQEDPTAFAPALGKASIAQNSDMARNARLALPENLRQFAHCKLHRAQQAHNAQAGRIGQSAGDGFDAHEHEHIKIFLYL